MKNLLYVLVLVLGFSASAQTKSKNAKYTFEVNGNCDQCKKRIEKAAYGVPGVKMALWDESTHQLNVLLNEEKTSVGTVKKALAKAGHDTDETRATDEDYNNLHHCCQYERKP